MRNVYLPDIDITSDCLRSVELVVKILRSLRFLKSNSEGQFFKLLCETSTDSTFGKNFRNSISSKSKPSLIFLAF